MPGGYSILEKSWGLATGEASNVVGANAMRAVRVDDVFILSSQRLMIGVSVCGIRRIWADVGVVADDEKRGAGDLAVFIPCTLWLCDRFSPCLDSLPTSAFA